MPWMLVSAVAWTSVHILSMWVSRRHFKIYQQLPFKMQLQWGTRVVAFIHAVLILALSAYCMTSDPIISQKPTYGISTLSYLTFQIATGYFMWDLLLCLLFFKEFGWGFLLHAVGCFFTFALQLEGLLPFYGCFYLLFEASTPFLNCHWLMDKMGIPNSSPLKKLNAVLLVVSFFVFRLLLGIGYTYHSIWPAFNYLSERADNSIIVALMYYYKATIVTLSLLNCYWFYTIVRFATRPPKTTIAPQQQTTTNADMKRKKE